MKRNRFPIPLSTILAVLAIALVCAANALAANKEKVIYHFATWVETFAGVTFDPAGNLYGTTYAGVPGPSTVFELTPTSSGRWNKKVLYRVGSCGGGFYTSLTFDPAGNLFGSNGGGCYGGIYGYVFELRPRPDGRWKEQTIQFGNTVYPGGPILLDAAGNLYGTYGVTDGSNGMVFESIPPKKKSGRWKEKVLYHFKEAETALPNVGLTFDQAGNLYGPATSEVFKLTRTSSGPWKYRVLHRFDSQFVSDVTFDPAGNLYGTTPVGGKYGLGAVFKLTPTSGNRWKESVLHSFKGGNDGAYPSAALVFDKPGNLYSTTQAGGRYNSGTVFKLSPGSSNHWKESVVYSFKGGDDGGDSVAPVVFDDAGNLYGTTLETVFEITP
jgi:uncharacterized repeat protein (TIGR03803 family)